MNRLNISIMPISETTWQDIKNCIRTDMQFTVPVIMIPRNGVVVRTKEPVSKFVIKFLSDRVMLI